VRKKSEYVIGFSSLSDGKHEFQYKIGNEFFEHFELSEVEGADLTVDLLLEKKPNMLIATFKAEGSIEVMCDRCTDSFRYPVAGEDEVIYKFAEEELDDEKIICILPNEIEIDITIPIYEFTTLLLPSRRIHPEGECNEEMLEEIDNYLVVESDEEEIEIDNYQQDESTDSEIDPRWSQLKNLK
jgi:uncharacterized protein